MTRQGIPNLEDQIPRGAIPEAVVAPSWDLEGGHRDFYIVAFCCHYCAYAAADLAGSLRLQYPTSVRVVKLPCTGKLDVLMILDAFEHGADGVMVAGCMEGDCHYQIGNLNARRRVNRVQTLLKEIGLEPDRVRMFNMSSAMGKKWAEAVAEMDAHVQARGPSPLRKSSPRRRNARRGDREAASAVAQI